MASSSSQPVILLQRGSNYMEVNGNLFNAEIKYSLANYVSADFVMGRGISAEFRRRYGHINTLKNQMRRVGEVAFFIEGGRFIYYLVTKDKYYYRPSYTSLRYAFKNLKKLMIQHKEKYLAIPKLESGLIWDKVRQIIWEEFEKTGIVIQVYCMD